jgi:hypothetical protein
LWEGLQGALIECASNCSYVLAAGFTTPADGFKHIHIGDGVLNWQDDDDGGKRNQHISIDGKGGAVINAHGKW